MTFFTHQSLITIILNRNKTNFKFLDIVFSTHDNAAARASNVINILTGQLLLLLWAFNVKETHIDTYNIYSQYQKIFVIIILL